MTASSSFAGAASGDPMLMGGLSNNADVVTFLNYDGTADNALQPGEMIKGIELPAPLQGVALRVEDLCQTCPDLCQVLQARIADGPGLVNQEHRKPDEQQQ